MRLVKWRASNMYDFDYMEYFTTGRESCKKKIEEIFEENKNKPIAIAINGKWGVGKSYFWKNEIVPFLKKKLNITPIYTSVFGKKDEKEIIEDLVSQFLTIENKNADAIRGFIEGTFKLLGKNIDLNSLFKFFKKEHMRDTIVCIDDFERLSDKISVQDILGLICELKENKGCLVFVIYNENELFKNDKSNQQNTEMAENKIIFEKYKEKVFDFQIHFAPPTREQFSIFMPKNLEKNFDTYKYFTDIISIDELLEDHHFTNLRELDRVNYTYKTLLKEFHLEKYPSEEFKKIYNYIFYPIAYAYHFGVKKEYFERSYGIGIGDLTSPHISMYHELLKSLLSELKYAFEFIQKTGFLYIPQLFQNLNTSTPIQICKIYLQNFVKKIIDDTKFHKEYIKEWDKENTLKEASINFFLKHKNDIESIPYMFGYRILKYTFDEEKNSINAKKIKSFSIELVMEEYRQEVLKLFNKWCDMAYNNIFNKTCEDNQEYFWINKFTFYFPLENMFKKLNIPMPQNKLVDFYDKKI
ncbi:hypothetical protein H2264_00435 [Campylobacter sp. RM10541]|uniref:P-loop NTPase fold protein n=1 Tax=Campylobacter molothri TaxID=1032242 RepID=UPI001D3ACC13|nr:hypothetical protein [Campylobacter sp. RM10536]MBZ7956246.1 hypothetical protein [Campylobacter sp. RM10541]